MYLPQQQLKMRKVDYNESLTLFNLQFSVIIKPLFESYTRMVNTGSIKDFCQSVMNWLEQHCTLPILRPGMV